MKTITFPFLWLYRVLGFFSFYSYEFIRANFILLVDILRINSKAHPAIVKLELQSKSDFEISLLASLISLTPGSLTLSIKANPPILFVHGIYVEDIDAFKKEMHTLEFKMLEALHYSKNRPRRDLWT